MPPTSEEVNQLIYKQFVECLQAIISLTDSLRELHEEVRLHSTNLVELRLEFSSLQDKFRDSGHVERSVIRLEERLSSLELTLSRQREDSRTSHQLTFSWVSVAITTVVVILTSFGVWFLQTVTKKGP